MNARPGEPLVDDPERVVVRDKRRLDPESGAVRAPAGAADGTPAAPQAEAGSPDPTGLSEAASTDAGGPGPDGAAGVDPRVAELTADLQRLSAEYANYRKRVERDRVAVAEIATAGLLGGLLPVLDDLDRAREHGDLTGAFKGVGDAVVALTDKLGLERYGEVGDPFDPAVHEALLTAEPDPTSSVSVCAAVLQPGYRLRSGRIIRAARVSVAEGAAAAEQPAPDQQ